MTALDGLIGGIRQIYLAGVEATFKRALDFTDMAGEILSDRIRLTVSGLRGVAVADTAPTAGDVLTYDGSEWTPSALAPVGATLFVDAVNGNDTSGTRGRADLPYLTIGAAVAAASSGDVVQVGPGTFAEAVTLPDLAVFTLRGAGTHTTVLAPPFEGIALRRQSAAALTALTIEQLRVVVDGATEALFINGENVATPGYAIGATDRGIILRDLVLEADPVDLNNVMWLKCIGHIRLQNVRTTGGSTTIYEVGDAVLRNFDTDGAALECNFRVAQTLPDGFTYGTTKLYSAKLGATTVAGYNFVTIDSSSRGEALAYTPDDGGVLELGSCRFGALTVTYTDGGAVESYGAWFEGNSSIAAGEHNFYGGGVVGSFTTTGTGETHGYNFMVTGSIVAGVSHHVTIHYPDGTSTEYPAI